MSALRNSQDGWLRDTVFVARTEHLPDLLRDITTITFPGERPEPGQELHRILADLQIALGRLSRQELERIAAEESTGGGDLAADDVKRVIDAARNRNRLLQLMDACVEAAYLSSDSERDQAETGQGDLVHPTVIFHSSEERFTVTLDRDLDVAEAAKKIVGDYFLRELPPRRRTVYLFDTDFGLVINGKLLQRGTLREAGVDDHSELTVFSSNGLWWQGHDARMAEMFFDTERLGMVSAEYRLQSYIRSTLRIRMRRRGLRLFGMAGGQDTGGTPLPE